MIPNMDPIAPGTTLVAQKGYRSLGLSKGDVGVVNSIHNHGTGSRVDATFTGKARTTRVQLYLDHSPKYTTGDYFDALVFGIKLRFTRP